MKAFVNISFESWAIGRVVRDLKEYAPARVEIVDKELEADLVVLHIIGRRDTTLRKVNELRKQGKRYAIIQYCIRSTKEPDTQAWRGIWKGAQVVWSYYDLPLLIEKDEHSFIIPNFYHAPLGVNSNIFRYEYSKPYRKYIIATNGGSRLSESIREAKIAADRVNRLVFHVGNFVEGLGKNVDFSAGMDDRDLAVRYNQCEFVAGLRRTEGFELGVVEGALCGARPIVFDAPHYRQWYNDFAEFIPEGSRQDVVNSLVALFQNGARPMQGREMSLIADRFDVKKIIQGFWSRV